MLEYLTLYEFVVALLMGLAGVCAFLWAGAAGHLEDVEPVKYQVLAAEEERDGGA